MMWKMLRKFDFFLCVKYSEGLRFWLEVLGCLVMQQLLVICSNA